MLSNFDLSILLIHKSIHTSLSTYSYMPHYLVIHTSIHDSVLTYTCPSFYVSIIHVLGIKDSIKNLTKSTN